MFQLNFRLFSGKWVIQEAKNRSLFNIILDDVTNGRHKTMNCAKMKLSQFCVYSEIDLDEMRKTQPNIFEVRHSSPGLIV